MNKVNKNKLGLVVGGFLGTLHLAWSVLVAFGWAQPLIDFVFNLHRIAPVYHILPFDLGTAIGLIVVTSILGYVFGWVIGAIWNKVHKA